MSSKCYCVSGKSWRRCFSQVVLTTPIVPASTRSATHLTIQTAPSVTTTTALQVNIIIFSSSIITFNIFSLSRISLSTFVKYSQALFSKKKPLDLVMFVMCVSTWLKSYMFALFDCQTQWQGASATSTAPCNLS